MPLDNGWEPIARPVRRTGAARFVVTPFTRLARTHAAAVAGDTLIALALANSLFFDIDPTAARSKVALYLALTMAPFAVVAPLIGPALDRMKGGRRFMVIAANGLRAVICVLMIGDLDSLVLFPEAFAVLVLSKSYHVAKSAIVPTVVRSDAELVEANSRLSLLSGLVGFAAAIPGGLAFAVAGSEGVLVLAVVVFAVAAVLGVRVPATQVAVDHTSQTEREELRGGGIILAASAMGLLRGIVGFLTFLVAFALRTSDAPTYQFAVVIAASGIGSLIGSLVAPALRRNDTAEERILQIVLVLTGVGALFAAWGGGIVAASALALCVGAAASTGKLAFDSVVQRDAPDANRGRSFARFETRFQLTWVVGAFVPVVISIPLEIGFVVIAGCAAFALFSYLAGLRALERGVMPVRRKPAEVIVSRIRRRRLGFAVDPEPDGPSSPAADTAEPPGAALDGAGDPPDAPRAAQGRASRPRRPHRRSSAHTGESLALAHPAPPGEPGADPPADRRPPPPPPPPPAPRDTESGETGGREDDGPSGTRSAADRGRRVVIDPTNLQ